MKIVLAAFDSFYIIATVKRIQQVAWLKSTAATFVRCCAISSPHQVPETSRILRLIDLFAATEVIGRINNYYVKCNVSACVCV